MIISKIIIILILLLYICLVYYPLVVENAFLVYKKNSYNDHKFLHSNFFSIFPKITNIGVNSFNQKKINICKNSKNQYKIIDLKTHMDGVKDIINNKYVKKHITDLIKSIISHMNINGKKVNLEDCVVVDLLRSKGQYFKSFHTDIEWGVFDKSNGFQIWYLYENEKQHGNMFIIDTDKVIPSSELVFTKKNIKIRKQCSKSHITNIHYSDIVNNIKYLSMKPGQCLIFGKSLYHMSDIRPSPTRHAINFRVIIKDADGGIPINTSQNCMYNYGFKYRLKNHKVKNNKIYVNTFDLINVY